MITVINYGMGNLGSLINMFKRIGVKAAIESDPEIIKKASESLAENFSNIKDVNLQEIFKNTGTDVKKLGEENFSRKILYLCKSRSECSYRETKEIFIRDALLTTEYYNSWCSCKIHKAHVLNKL